MSPQSHDFYIGWDDAAAKAPSIGKLLSLGLLLVAAAAGFAWMQSPSPQSRFEFGVDRGFEGTLQHVPYPTLVVEREDGSTSRWLLTVFGKRGADDVTLPLDGHRVRLIGSLIYRDDVTMVELRPETLEDMGLDGAALLPAAGEARRATLRGEIVDSKCYLGVMKPGATKPHRACATRCISGGVPPVLLTRDSEGNATYYLLVDEQGGAVNDRVLEFVAEQIEITGAVTSLGSLELLSADPASYRRVDD